MQTNTGISQDSIDEDNSTLYNGENGNDRNDRLDRNLNANNKRVSSRRNSFDQTLTNILLKISGRNAEPVKLGEIKTFKGGAITSKASHR